MMGSDVLVSSTGKRRTENVNVTHYGATVNEW